MFNTLSDCAFTSQSEFIPYAYRRAVGESAQYVYSYDVENQCSETCGNM